MFKIVDWSGLTMDTAKTRLDAEIVLRELQSAVLDQIEELEFEIESLQGDLDSLVIIDPSV